MAYRIPMARARPARPAILYYKCFCIALVSMWNKRYRMEIVARVEPNSLIFLQLDDRTTYSMDEL